MGGAVFHVGVEVAASARPVLPSFWSCIGVKIVVLLWYLKNSQASPQID